MPEKPEQKTFERTTVGLRDALMSEMEDIRAGIATPQEAEAFASLAQQVIESLRTDIVVDKLNYDMDQMHLENERLHQEKRLLLSRTKEKEEEVETEDRHGELSDW